MSFRLETYPGAGEKNSSECHYSQAVKVGNIIRTSGQGGWDDQANIAKDLPLQDEVAQAFKNAMTAVNAIDPNVTWKVRRPSRLCGRCTELREEKRVRG